MALLEERPKIIEVDSYKSNTFPAEPLLSNIYWPMMLYILKNNFKTLTFLSKYYVIQTHPNHLRVVSIAHQLMCGNGCDILNEVFY